MGDISEYIIDQMALGRYHTGYVKEEEDVEEPYLMIVNETEKAWQVVFETGTSHWFPKSICTLDEDYKTIIYPKGLIDER